MIMPEVMIGEIPSSIRVPLLEAKIVLKRYIGSVSLALTIPYRGI